MRASRIVPLIASLAACGGPPSAQPPAPSPTPAPTTIPVAVAVAGPTSAALPAGATVEPAADETDVARTAALAVLGRLPTMIDSVELTAVEARAIPFLLMRNDPFVRPTALPCTTELAAKTSHILELGYPFPGDKNPLDGATVVALVTTAAAKEVAACLAKIAEVKPRPTKAKDQRDTLIGRTVVRDLGDGLLVLVGNKVSADPEATARALFATAAGAAPHPLARILEHGAATPRFSAYALDYTWELLGVPSTGMILEYADRHAAGPIAIRLRFADNQTARLALARFDHPDDAVFRSAFGDSAAEVMATLRTRAKITLRDDEVILRGTATERELEYNEMPFNMFLVLGVPLARPLTREEQRRLFRPLPGTPEAATFRAEPWVPAHR